MYHLGEFGPEALKQYPEDSAFFGDVDAWMAQYYDTGSCARDWEQWRVTIDRDNEARIRGLELGALGPDASIA